MNLREALQNTGALQRGSRVQTGDGFPFDGGLNLTDPPNQLAPGQLLGCKNYEPSVRGGYSRVQGYERFDGQTSPTDARFIVVQFDASADPLIIGGETFRLYQQSTTTLLATGVVYYVKYTNSPTDTEGYLVIEWTSGFEAVVDANNILDNDIFINSTNPPGSPVARALAAWVDDAPTDDLRQEFEKGKTAFLRIAIQEVGVKDAGFGAPSGPVRGVHIYKENVYAFRDITVGELTQGAMFRASADGWDRVFLGETYFFDQGLVEITEGMTLTDVTTVKQLVVRRVVVEEGVWGRNAKGYIVTTVADPGFVWTPNEDMFIGAVKHARFLDQDLNTLPAGGYYRFRNHNFLGAEDQYRMYGVNGVGQAFEFEELEADGSKPLFVPIRTGMETDTPTHLAVHNDHLVLAFPGGSIQNSGYQQPLNWNPITGADERSAGDNVTEMIEETNNTLVIATRRNTYLFYGDVVENFQFRIYTPNTGMIPKTVGRIGQTIYLDDRGFTTLRATASFGNFQANSISDRILPLVQRVLRESIPVGTIISRSKNLYRVFFSNGRFLSIGSRPGNKLTGWMTGQVLEQPYCLTSNEIEQELTEGGLYAERLFMGCENGYVYELDKGRSYDGQTIEGFLRLAYHMSRSPERYKRYRRAQIDLDVVGPTTILAAVDFNFGNREGQTEEPSEFFGSGGFWDVSNWDEFVWSKSAFDQLVIKVEGSGYNVGLFFYTSADDEDSHTLYGVAMQMSMRRINRGTQEG